MSTRFASSRNGRKFFPCRVPPAAIATLTYSNAHHVQGLIVKVCGSTPSKFSPNSNLDVSPFRRTNMYAGYSRGFDSGVRYSVRIVSQLLPQRRKLLRSISKVNNAYRRAGKWNRDCLVAIQSQRQHMVSKTQPQCDWGCSPVFVLFC